MNELEKELIDMEIGEEKGINKCGRYSRFLRVPGGWIVSVIDNGYDFNNVFVPLPKEVAETNIRNNEGDIIYTSIEEWGKGLIELKDK